MRLHATMFNTIKWWSALFLLGIKIWIWPLSTVTRSKTVVQRSQKEPGIRVSLPHCHYLSSYSRSEPPSRQADITKSSRWGGFSIECKCSLHRGTEFGLASINRRQGDPQGSGVSAHEWKSSPQVSNELFQIFRRHFVSPGDFLPISFALCL